MIKSSYSNAASSRSNIRMKKLEADNKLRAISMRASVDFALSGIRSLLLVNGGAIFVILTFMGNASPRAFDHNTIIVGLCFFIAGLATALTMVLLSYLAQEKTTKDLIHTGGFTRAAVVVAGLSAALFFGGAAITALAFEPSPDKNLPSLSCCCP